MYCGCAMYVFIVCPMHHVCKCGACVGCGMYNVVCGMYTMVCGVDSCDVGGGIGACDYGECGVYGGCNV